MPDGYPPLFGKLTRIFNNGDMATVVQGLRDEGFIRPHIEVDAEALRAFLAPYVEPTAVEEFTFSREWLQNQAATVTDLRPGNVVRQLNLPVVLRPHPPGARGGDRRALPARRHRPLPRGGHPLGPRIRRRGFRRAHGCRELTTATCAA